MTEWIVTSSVLILMVMGLRRLFRGRISLRLQYALWALVLVRLLIPGTVVPSRISVMNYVTLPAVGRVEAAGEGSAARSPLRAVPEREPEEEQPASAQMDRTPSEERAGTERGSGSETVVEWRKVLGGLWLCGGLAVAGCLLVSNLRFYLRLRRTRIPFQGRKGIYVARGLPSPCLYGLFAPGIYLTPEAAEDPVMLEHVLRHERTHLRHGDHIWACLRGAALALHWYNPLVWMAALLSRRDAELACDEGALRRAEDWERAAYGRTLIQLVTAKPRAGDLLCWATTMSSGRSGLKERITMIAKKPRTLAITLIAVALLAGAAAGCTFTGDVLLSQEPWEELSQEELSYFNGDGFFNGEYMNIRNQFLSSLYDSPEEIDLFLLLYDGTGEADELRGLEGVDRAQLTAAIEKDAGFGEEGPPCAATVLTPEGIEDVLNQYLGMGLEDTQKIGMENFSYLSQYGVYYYFHGDTNYRASVTFDQGWKQGELIALLYQDTYTGTGSKIVLLEQTEEGGYHFLANRSLPEEGTIVRMGGAFYMAEAVHDYVVERVRQAAESYSDAQGGPIVDAKVTGVTEMELDDRCAEEGLRLYRLEYRLKPTDPDEVLLPGGMTMEDGWLTEQTSAGQPLVLFHVSKGAEGGNGAVWELVGETNTLTVTEEYGGDYAKAALDMYGGTGR